MEIILLTLVLTLFAIEGGYCACATTRLPEFTPHVPDPTLNLKIKDAFSKLSEEQRNKIINSTLAQSEELYCKKITDPLLQKPQFNLSTLSLTSRCPTRPFTSLFKLFDDQQNNAFQLKFVDEYFQFKVGSSLRENLLTMGFTNKSIFDAIWNAWFTTNVPEGSTKSVTVFQRTFVSDLVDGKAVFTNDYYGFTLLVDKKIYKTEPTYTTSPIQENLMYKVNGKLQQLDGSRPFNIIFGLNSYLGMTMYLLCYWQGQEKCTFSLPRVNKTISVSIFFDQNKVMKMAKLQFS